MSDGGDEIREEEDDPETSELLRIARAAMTSADPVPTEVTELAKLAFAFRDVETIEPTDTAELATVRSATGSALQATHGETSLIWSEADGLITGVLHGHANASVAVQTTADTWYVELDEGTGAFEIQTPSGAYRLVVTEPGHTWATSWSS